MDLKPVELGATRTDKDGCRRYRPIQMTFDARNVTLDQEIQGDWEPEIQAQWHGNQSAIRMELLAEHGTVDGESKIDNYRAMGPAPWSVVAQHNKVLEQVRSAFAHGDFYPALVSACALGERILNHLLLELRQDYQNHRSTTRRVRGADTFRDWGSAIKVLHGWDVLPDRTREQYERLEKQRHAAVHYDPEVNVIDRVPALEALLALQQIVAAIFSVIGGPPTYIHGTLGASYFSLSAEDIPLVKRVFLPRSALVSPRHRMQHGYSPEGDLGWQVLDDIDYDPTPPF